MPLDGFERRHTGDLPLAAESRESIRRMIPTQGHIKSGVIQERLSIDGPTVNAAIHMLRCSGVPIGSSSKGYFMGTMERIEEYARSVNSMRQRARSIMDAADGMERSLDWLQVRLTNRDQLSLTL